MGIYYVAPMDDVTPASSEDSAVYALRHDGRCDWALDLNPIKAWHRLNAHVGMHVRHGITMGMFEYKNDTGLLHLLWTREKEQA